MHSGLDTAQTLLKAWDFCYLLIFLWQRVNIFHDPGNLDRFLPHDRAVWWVKCCRSEFKYSCLEVERENVVSKK